MAVEEGELVNGVSDGTSAAALVKHEPEARWKASISRTVQSVVSIRYCRPVAFDTNGSSASQATGFVVDSERGYVLTNRHVVGAGPFWGHIVFHNHEEVDAYPIYRDPVHDFGFLRFDPKAIKYHKPVALELRPDLAEVGVDIKVIGNDAGETMSILSGTISRTDRNVPDYSSYRDYNTCYYQASAGATGGSSGSPVVNAGGQAIAMQAGGRTDGSSTDYFLPLNSPQRALEELRHDKVPVRGSVQCSFMLDPFDKCRQLGLTSDWESEVRAAHPEQTSLLVADRIVPEGVAHNHIKEGDILVRVNGEMATSFNQLENILDGSVGQSVSLELQRGGKDVKVEIQVIDFKATCPEEFVTVAEAVFHRLSDQMAHQYTVPCKGVFISANGALELSSSQIGILDSIATKKTPDMESFIEAMKTIPDLARVVVSWKKLGDLNTVITDVVTMNRHWSEKMTLSTRNDATGDWDFKTLGEALPPEPPKRLKGTFAVPTGLPRPAIGDMIRSFVRVRAILPFSVDGAGGRLSHGKGIIIDAARGLVLTASWAAPHKLCDVSVTIANSILVNAKVVFLHPSYNYCVVKYDPSLVDAPVHTPTFSSRPVTQGQSTFFIGHNSNFQMMFAGTSVTRISCSEFEPVGTPRYRPINMSYIIVESSLTTHCSDGVLMGENGEVEALWMQWEAPAIWNTYGLSSELLKPVIDCFQRGEIPQLRCLGAEFKNKDLLTARTMGVKEEWIEKVMEKQAPHELFIVDRVFGNKSTGLNEGDVLLTLNGALITEATQLDVTHWHEVLDAEIVRNGEQKRLRLETVKATDLESDKFITFCGLVLQKPHLAVRQQVRELPSEVYIAASFSGSPASMYNIWSTNFLTHINDIELESVESIIAISQTIAHNSYFRIRGATIKGAPFAMTMKKNDHWFPTVEWTIDESDPKGWRQQKFETEKTNDDENGLSGKEQAEEPDENAQEVEQGVQDGDAAQQQGGHEENHEASV